VASLTYTHIHTHIGKQLLPHTARGGLRRLGEHNRAASYVHSAMCARCERLIGLILDAWMSLVGTASLLERSILSRGGHHVTLLK